MRTQAVASQSGVSGLSSVVMDAGCLVDGAVKSQQSWYRGKTVMGQKTNGAHSREVTAMLRANAMVEREQRGDGV